MSTPAGGNERGASSCRCGWGNGMRCCYVRRPGEMTSANDAAFPEVCSATLSADRVPRSQGCVVDGSAQRAEGGALVRGMAGT